LAIAAAAIIPTAVVLALLSGPINEVDVFLQAIFLFTMVPIITMGAYMWATGKGAMLIAGYNTSPKSVRDTYNAEELAKFTGKLVTISVAVLLLAMESIFLLDSMVLFGVLLGASLAILIFGIYYMNTRDRFRRTDVPAPIVTKEDKKRSKLIIIASVTLTAVVLIAVFALMGMGSVGAMLEEGGLHVTAPLVDDIIPYDKITSVELRDHLETGHRVGGFGGSEVQSGNFENDEFGRYILASYNSVPSHIIVHHEGGHNGVQPWHGGGDSANVCRSPGKVVMIRRSCAS